MKEAIIKTAPLPVVNDVWRLNHARLFEAGLTAIDNDRSGARTFEIVTRSIYEVKWGFYDKPDVDVIVKSIRSDELGLTLH